MATRVPVPAGELLCVNELERKLTDLSEQVALKKEEVRSNFQQFHHLLSVREEFLLKEMDDIVTLARQEVAEKKGTLQELYKARGHLEGDLTKNEFKKSPVEQDDEMVSPTARGIEVSCIELEWNREKLEQSLIEACRVVCLREKPSTEVNYSAKLSPVWYHDGTSSGEITNPMQLVVDSTTQNIFIADISASRIQVFSGEGNHLYKISTPPYPIGIALSDEYIFVSTDSKLVLKIEKSSNDSIKFVETENQVFGIETSSDTDIYVCEYSNQSVIAFDSDLKFLRRIKLHFTQVDSDTCSNSIKLYEENMYVMFGGHSPIFHLRIFTLDGELVRCLIRESEVGWSFFFSLDQIGNIIVADWGANQIKIFSQEGEVLHTITSDMLPEDQKFNCPFGVVINRRKRIIVAHCNKRCNLLAF